jgi:hypothetical protein
VLSVLAGLGRDYIYVRGEGESEVSQPVANGVDLVDVVVHHTRA